MGDYFLVTEKNLSFSQKGIPYLSLRIKDKTGEMEGKIWDNAESWGKVFKKGDVIAVEARAVSFRGGVQLMIVKVSKVEGEVDLSEFLPTTKADRDGMWEELGDLIKTVVNPYLKTLLLSFYEDGLISQEFKIAPAAKGFHHVYLGGLLEHTLSVTKLLNEVCRHYRSINRDLIITGGILHDIGKIREFSYERLIDYTDAGRLIGHIVMGVQMVDDRIAQIENFPPALALELRHLILSHHGDLEFGSPKRPKTVEALIVHYIDDLDAKVNAFQEFIHASVDNDSDWTPFHRLFERFIYKGSNYLNEE